MPIEEFERIWCLLIATWCSHRHAFVRGCGRETLSHWVLLTTGQFVHPSDLRRTLRAAAALGWVRMERTPGRCTRFYFNDL